MSEPIKVGDLVIVAKPQTCCGNSRTLGQVFRVTKIAMKASRCIFCGRIAETAFASGKRDGHDTKLHRLRRIDPNCLADETEKEEAL